MAEIVNLRRERRRRAREQAGREADANRALHGLTPTERDARLLEQERLRLTLDGARLEDET